MTHRRLFIMVAALSMLVGCPMLEPKKGRRPAPPAGTPSQAASGTPPSVNPTALTATGDACSQPNPPRMTIDASLMESVETLAGGDFEDDGRLPLIAGGTGSRAAAARSGKWGWSVPQAGTVSVSFSPEKAVDMRFSAWVRSTGAPIQARLSIGAAERPAGGGEGRPQGAPPGGRPGGRPGGMPPSGRPGLPGGGPGGGAPGGPGGPGGGQQGGPSHAGEWVTVGSEWTEVTLQQTFKTTIPTALLSVETTGSASVDDISIHAPAWKRAEGPRNVGGIQVPANPVAPFLFTVVVHVEDDLGLRLGGARWEEATVVLEKLSAVLHRHGGALTIQPEMQWLEGAEVNARQTGQANRITRMAQQSGVQFSTHTHGPTCVDSQGTAYGLSDCQQHPEYSKDVSASATLAYIQARQQALQRVTGQFPTDHNGNFDLSTFTGLQSMRVATISGFKDRRDQSGLPSLYTNPWRPAGTAAAGTLDGFLQHDPNGPVVYLPGAGVTLTRSPGRLPDQLARVTSQVLRFADPGRVNTFYTILAETAFSPPAGTERSAYYSGGGLDRDLGGIESMLTVLIDPLVATGYIKWASLPEMGAAYLAQEKLCRAR
jgi:hypothetical protein